MTSNSLSTTVRAAFVAFAAFGTLSYVTTHAAEARHRHHSGVVLHIGDGIGVGFHHRHHSRLLIVDGGYRCGFLYRKAIRTGSAYWWDRYSDCRYGE